jgi:hypothetical protein
MSSPAPAQSPSTIDALRWKEWQERGLQGDRRRAVAMKWVLALITIMLGGLIGRLL